MMCKKILVKWALRLALICLGPLTAWAAPGDVDTGFLNGLAGANGAVRALAAQPDGKVVISGDFDMVNGVARSQIARLLGGFGISGRLADSNGVSLAGVAVSLSGASSQVAITDHNGNYSFPTLQTGGNYTVIPNSAAFVFSPARMDFNNLAADQTQNYTAATNAVPPAALPLTDDFSGATATPTGGIWALCRNRRVPLTRKSRFYRRRASLSSHPWLIRRAYTITAMWRSIVLT